MISVHILIYFFSSISIVIGINPLAHKDFFDVRQLYSIKSLFDAGVHLGHKTGVWNPLMKQYIYGDRHGNHIIDLNETDRHLFLALNVTSHIAYRKGVILFVCCRPQFQHLVQKTARECQEFFVIQRWRGGILTNAHKLLPVPRLPDLIIFLSVPYNMDAIRESAQANIPSIGIVDTDCNPNLITYPIAGNDDSLSSLELYCRLFSTAILNAKVQRQNDDNYTIDKSNDGETPRDNSRAEMAS
ncbi:uncharacterized protein TRIADDRAFT_21033 [Trichoplax adhaerens]|uniref:Small ribosomal subunit protein uS2m n=1 Tax=Trichoplax adhaerens TaxID=10228 RepID=B3RNK5_TRIAD|nr:hypothetical protein TRIADDRAFT_21033 [Trichoplax adhaerens]EDV28036.1 hypothetical protein TRIADDRAFT_21033 [Trichoplax adhaerens]|eukprot:XP_002109870.1 hypothetical protein TRIADDRAFT_21033 [Trichoplax adhaerens]